MTRRFAVVVLSLLLAFAAHSDAPPSGSPELSFDGLKRVESKRFPLAWIRPGVDFSGYRKLLVLPAEIAYKRPPKRGPTAHDNFALTESQAWRLRKAARDAFSEELFERGGWERTEEVGPDVLLARGGLIDLVVHLPPPTAGRSTTYVRSFGEATLVIELYDSQTREILARIADRGAAEPPGGRLGVDVQAPAEVRRMFASWARRFREALAEVRSRTP